MLTRKEKKMKKKLLFIVCIMALLCCIFALSVSAAEVEVGNVFYTTYTSSAYEGYDGTAAVNTKNQSNTATIISIPDTITVDGKTYVVNAIQGSAFNGNKTVQEIRILSKYITVIPGSMILNTHGGALSKIFIDFSIITEVAQAGLNPSTQSNGNSPVTNNFYYYDAKAFIADGSEVRITSPDFSSLVTVGQAAFQGAQFEKLVVPASASLSTQCFRMVQASEIIIKGDRTSIPNYAFAHCRNARKIVVESRNLQTIGGSSFALNFQPTNGVYPSCDFYIDMSKVKTIDGSAFIFSSGYDHGITTVQWYNLEGEEAVDLSSVETLGDSCFASSNLGSADYIKWPNAIKSISNQAFRLCNINQVLIINPAEGSKIALSFWAFAGNTFTGVVLGKDVIESSATFPNATFAVVLADSFKIQDKNFISSSTPLYCKEITVNTSFSTQQIANATILNLGVCGAGATVTFPNTSTLTLGTFNHTENEGTPTVPSCTVPTGTQYNCTLCNTFLRYEETTPAPGHSYDATNPNSVEPLTCTTNEIKHYTCSTCSEEVLVVTAYAVGHKHTVISYPVVSTDGVEGIKRYTCANFDGTCGDYYEYAYRMLPDELDVRIEMNDGTKLTVKSSLIWKYKTLEVDNVYSCWLYNGSLNSSFVVGDVTYKTSDIKAISVPYGITKIEQNFTHPYSNIKVIDLTDARDVALPSTFRDNGNITEVILGDGVKLQGDSFRYINSLTVLRIANGATVVFPSGANVFSDFRGLDKIIIGDGANVRFERNTTFNWNGSTTRRIAEIIIGDNTTVYFGYKTFNGEINLTTITFGENGNYTFAGECFQGAPLTALNIPASSTVTFTGDSAFRNCASLVSVTLPASVTEVRKETFNGCSSLESVVLMGATSIGENAFNATTDKTLTIFSHANGDLSINSKAFANRTNVVLYTMSTNVTSLSTTSYTIYSGIPHSQYEAKLDPSCLANGYDGYATDCPCGSIVSEVTFTIYTSGAEATSGSYGVHTVIPSLGGHTDKIVIVYANGFDKEGSKSVACAVCSEVLSEATVVNPIFVHEGYSYKLNGDITGIESAFKVDKEALKAYEQASGKKITFGMIIANPTYLGESFFANGIITASKGAIQVQVDMGDYSIFSCYISGFQKIDPQVNLELVIAGYTYEGNDVSTLKLMQKTYEVGDESPAVSKVTKSDATLHTVNIANVKTPVSFPANIKEFGTTEEQQ